jgi:UDP-N-acetyl-D-mannosaminuronate dehydrogenase
VGLPLAFRALEAGYDVIGIDQDSRRVKQLGAAILTDHDVFDYELVQSAAGYVFDTRNRYGDPLQSGFDRRLSLVRTAPSGGP